MLIDQKNLPDNFILEFRQIFDIWVTLKVIAIAVTGLYSAFGKGDGLGRLFRVTVFGVCVYLLTGCVGSDFLAAEKQAQLAQQQTQQKQIEANIQQQQAEAKQMLQQTQQQELQTQALSEANKQLQLASEAAKLAQAQNSMVQAESNQAQAQAFGQSVVAAVNALDNAQERTSRTTTTIIAVLAVLFGFVVGGVVWVVSGWLKYKTHVLRSTAQAQELEQYKIDSGIAGVEYEKLSNAQLRALAAELGYMVARDNTGRWAIIDRNNLKRLTKNELLLELKNNE